MQIVTMDELQTFLGCPAHWLYKYYYKAPPTYHKEELYYLSYKASVSYYTQQRLIGKGCSREQLVEYWAYHWMSLARHHGIPEQDIREMGSKGAVHLSKLVHNLSPYSVMMSGESWEYHWPTLDMSVQGAILALLRFKIGTPDDNNRFYVLEVLPPRARFWAGPQAIRILQLAGEACRGSIKSKTRSEGPRISTLTIDPWRDDYIMYPDVSFSDLEPLVGNVLTQIKYLLPLPNEGPHCVECPYRKACDAKLMKTWYLNDRSRGLEFIKDKTCNQASVSSSEISLNTLNTIMKSLSKQ